jgi:hypothetical protein
MMAMQTSCKKSFFDVNVDPNSPLDVPPRTLLPTATVGIGFSNGNELGKVAALLMQYNAGVSGLSLTTDTWVLASTDNQWNGEIFGAALVNLNTLIKKTEAFSPAYSGIAKLEKAYIMSLTTDLYGDVPYTEAGQGLTNKQPKFDAQQDIYLGNTAKGVTSLFNLVRSGMNDLTRAATATVLRPTTDDLVYGGTLSSWTRVGNSLLLKFALQVSNVAPDTTRNVINSILSSAAPYIDDAAYDLNVPFSTSNPNPYYQQDVSGSIPNTQMLSNRFLALMRNQNDSLRLSKYYTKPAATFIGYDNGSPFAAPTAANRSLYGTYVFGPLNAQGSAPIRLLTSFQSAFILAESALRFSTTGDPNTYYQAGIRRAMTAAGLTTAQIDAYFLANPTIVTLTGTTADKLKQIITQKYIASVGNAIESYNDYRRTGYPVLTNPLTTAGDDPATFPKRYPYVTSEGSANPNQPNPRPLTNVKVWWGL